MELSGSISSPTGHHHTAICRGAVKKKMAHVTLKSARTSCFSLSLFVGLLSGFWLPQGEVFLFPSSKPLPQLREHPALTSVPASLYNELIPVRIGSLISASISTLQR